MRSSLLCLLVIIASPDIGCSDSFTTESARTPDAGTGGKRATTSTGGSPTGGAVTSSGGTATAGTGPVISNDASFTGGAGPVISNDGSANPGREAGANEGGPRAVELELVITHDTDDATWINGDDERLEYSVDQPWDEVGADAEMGRAGFRFEPPIPPGSTIRSAVLRLRRTSGAAADTETMFVQVFESASVPPFDDNHVHAPAGHVPEGLSSMAVSGFVVGANDSQTDSPDLRELVQHVVNRPDWTAAGSIGFVLSPDTMSTWVSFADAASGSNSATFSIRYVPPQR